MKYSINIANKLLFSEKNSFVRRILILSISAVALSICVIVIASAMIKGFKKEISEKMFGFWGHIHVNSAIVNSTFEPIPMIYDARIVAQIKQIQPMNYTFNGKVNTTLGGVRHVQSYATKAGIIKTKNTIEGMLLKGVSSDFDSSFLKNNLAAGAFFQNTDSTHPILISQTTADRLEVGVGKKLRLYFVENDEQKQVQFHVTGIYKTGLEEYDKKFAITTLADVQNLLGWQPDQISGLEIFVDNIDDSKTIKNYIYNEIISAELSAQTVREEQPGIFDWLDLQNVNERVIIILMLTICIINMITAILIFILERTNMVGILKSLGARNAHIQQIFFFYGAIIIVVGITLGNLLGVGLGLLQHYFKFIKLNESDYYLSYAPIYFDVPYLIQINFLAIIVILLFITLPTYLITRITPVETIRFR